MGVNPVARESRPASEGKARFQALNTKINGANSIPVSGYFLIFLKPRQLIHPVRAVSHTTCPVSPSIPGPETEYPPPLDTFSPAMHPLRCRRMVLPRKSRREEWKSVNHPLRKRVHSPKRRKGVQRGGLPGRPGKSDLEGSVPGSEVAAGKLIKKKAPEAFPAPGCVTQHVNAWLPTVS